MDAAAARSSLVPFSPAESEQIRTSVVDGDDRLMCPRCGTVLETTVPIAGAGTISLIWQLCCPGCRRTMVAGQVLDQLLGRLERSRASVQDREAARWIPEEWVTLQVRPAIRAMTLVDRCWSGYPEHERRDLAQVLCVLLGEVKTAADISPEIRQACEQAVVRWIELARYASR